MNLSKTTLALPLLLVSAAAGAQDISADPTFGSVELETGFMPDPHSAELAAGGSLDASATIGEGCLGFIADAPDFDLTYTAGETFPLNLYVQSEADTTLVVNLPDGTWACDDDTFGFNPALSFDSPQSGLYNIWVGTYDSGATPPATLHVSELAPAFADAGADMMGQQLAGEVTVDISADPTFGAVELETGFMPDPHTVELLAGGPVVAADLDPSCAGMIGTAPDVDFTFTAGDLPLIIAAYSEADTTLVVNLPDGTWACNDDEQGLDPLLAFENPQSGLYNIWVGAFGAADLPAATLHLSEIDPR